MEVCLARVIRRNSTRGSRASSESVPTKLGPRNRHPLYGYLLRSFGAVHRIRTRNLSGRSTARRSTSSLVRWNWRSPRILPVLWFHRNLRIRKNFVLSAFTRSSKLAKVRSASFISFHRGSTITVGSSSFTARSPKPYCTILPFHALSTTANLWSHVLLRVSRYEAGS